MPIVIGAIDDRIDSNHIRRLSITLPIEQKKLNIGRIARKYAEIHSVRRDCGAKRNRLSDGHNPRKSMHRIC